MKTKENTKNKLHKTLIKGSKHLALGNLQLKIL